MIDFYDVCEKGGRDQNQDSVICLNKNNTYLFSVADGLGAYADSKLASFIVHEVIKELFMEDNACMSGSGKEDFLRRCVKMCHDVLAEYKQKNGVKDSYTTIVILLISENEAQWCHIGDSRLYYFKNGKVSERTEDHSVVQTLFRAGMIKEEEIRKHPDRGKLLKAIGSVDKKPEAEISRVHPVTPGDAFLLCSDGFWEYVTEEDMAETLDSFPEVREWITAMETNVKDAGMGRKADNYSAIGVCVS